MMTLAHFTPNMVLGKLLTSSYLTLERENNRTLYSLIDILLTFHDDVEVV